MKKFTILLIAMSAALGAFAQFEKGRMLVGGTLGFNTLTQKSKVNGTSVKVGKWTTFSLTPQAGIFIIDNLAVGAGLDIELSKWKDEFDNDDDYSTTEIEFMPMARYYLPMGVFFHGEFGIGASNRKYEDGSDDEKYGVTSFALAVGYAHFLNDHVAIEPMAGFGSKTEKDKDTDYKYVWSGPFVQVSFQIFLENLFEGK